MTNLADIAADIRKHSPGVLPESLRIDHDGTLCFIQHGRADNGSTDLVSNWYTPLPDDIAADVLIAAMVKTMSIYRAADPDQWIVTSNEYYAETDEEAEENERLAQSGPRKYYDTCGCFSEEPFSDSDYGGSIGACYAAWKWAKGIT